jgi:flagellar protein FliT
MITSQQVIAVYGRMVELTDRMVAAAASGDWDELALLEGQCAAQLRILKASEAGVELPAPVREQKVKSIRLILDNDRKIRDLTMPWMAQLSALISNTRTQGRLLGAYGTV